MMEPGMWRQAPGHQHPATGHWSPVSSRNYPECSWHQHTAPLLFSALQLSSLTDVHPTELFHLIPSSDQQYITRIRANVTISKVD